MTGVPAPCAHSFTWMGVIPPTHCPHCGACLACGGRWVYPQPTPWWGPTPPVWYSNSTDTSNNTWTF